MSDAHGPASSFATRFSLRRVVQSGRGVSTGRVEREGCVWRNAKKTYMAASSAHAAARSLVVFPSWASAARRRVSTNASGAAAGDFSPLLRRRLGIMVDACGVLRLALGKAVGVVSRLPRSKCKSGFDLFVKPSRSLQVWNAAKTVQNRKGLAARLADQQPR